MEDPNSGWGVGTSEGGSIAYVDGNLQMDTAAGGAWQWTRRLTGSTDNAVHFEGIYEPSGAGYMGLLCGDSGDVLWGGMANLYSGEYAFIKLEATGATILAQGLLEELRIDPGEISRFALDCAGTATGSFRMQIYPAGTNSGAHYAGAPGEGPTAIDRVALYTQSIDEPYSLTVDYLIGFGGDGDTSPTPGGGRADDPCSGRLAAGLFRGVRQCPRSRRHSRHPVPALRRTFRLRRLHRASIRRPTWTRTSSIWSTSTRCPSQA